MAFQGSLKELPLPDIIQLVSVSGKTGAFTLRSGDEAGDIYLRGGQIVHAELGDLSGEEAVYELAIWDEGDFVFTPGKEVQQTTIQKSNTNLLMEAARRIDEWQVLSKRIPSTRLIPVFTDQVATTSVSFTPGEWQLICKIDERRSIDEIAAGLGMSPFDVCKLLYGLITSGLVTLRETLGGEATDRLKKMTPTELASAAKAIHGQALELLGDRDGGAELESIYRMVRAELENGREVDAVLDLIRSGEKVVASSLGADHGKAFLERVGGLLKAA